MLTSLNHITLAVMNIDRSFSFYHDVLGLTPLVKWGGGAYFLVGTGENSFWFCLNVDPKREANPCYTHYAFSVSQSQFKEVSEKILKAGTKVFKENTSPGDSLYFFDPDNHKLEIHASTWQERVRVKKENPGAWKNVQWFV